MAIARLGGSDIPLESYVWTDDPAISGASRTVIEPDTTLEVVADGSVRPYLPNQIRFRDGERLCPVAPFFELHVCYKEGEEKKSAPLTLDLLGKFGEKDASPANLSYQVYAANRKAARRTGDPACAFGAQLTVAGDDYVPRTLLAASLRHSGAEPLVLPERPIPLGQFQVIRPLPGFTLLLSGSEKKFDAMEMGVNLSVLRVRFTPARGEVYGPPQATSAPAPGTQRVHEIVRPENRILNPNSVWTQYTADYSRFNNPEPSDTYDGADIDDNRAWGVVDDTCDVVLTASLVIGGRRFTATARVFVGPPDFAPDRRPFLSLADDLADRDLESLQNPKDDAELETMEKEIADLFQRVYETASLVNLDAIRERALRENNDGGVVEIADLPKLDDRSLTKHDKPFADLVNNLMPDAPAGATSDDPLPYADLAKFAHDRLSDLDALVAFLAEKDKHVHELVRPPYGVFSELEKEPKNQPAKDHRDPRVDRDLVHDMRMPPYMRDSDATALSLTRRQYRAIMVLVDRLRGQLHTAVTAAAREMVHPRTSRSGPLAGLLSPIRRRVNAFIASQRGGDAPPPTPQTEDAR